MSAKDAVTEISEMDDSNVYGMQLGLLIGLSDHSTMRVLAD